MKLGKEIILNIISVLTKPILQSHARKRWFY